MKNASIARLLALVGALLLSTHAVAFPVKPIRIIVPYPPGGPSDFTARVVAKHFGAGLGGTVIVENKPGAAAAIGTDAVAKAAPDGYTLLFAGAPSLVSLPYLRKSLPYTLDNLMIINEVAATPYVLVVNSSVQAKNVQELIAFAKANPGKLNFGSSGVGQAYHLVGELFMMRTGVELNHVAYKGSAPALTDLLNGNIQMIFDLPQPSLPFLSSGKLRVLGVTGTNRVTQLPDVATFGEQGVRDFDLQAWSGVFAPKGVPTDIAARLHAEVGKIVQIPEVKELLGNSGFQAISCPSLEACAAELHKESERVGSVIKKIGLQLE